MEPLSEWKLASKDLYQKQNLSGQHGFFSQIEMPPLSVADDEELVFLGDVKKFINIVPYHDELFTTEFIESGSCGAMLGDEWPPHLKKRDLFLYLLSSPSITSFKKALLTEADTPNLNLGLDPFGMGLWKSTLYKDNLPTDLFAQALSHNFELFRLTGQPYAMAGASDIQQLALFLSGVVQLINNYQGQQNPSDIFRSLSFEVPLKSHVFLSAAKVQALKILLQRLAEIYDLEDVKAPSIYAVPSVRFLSAREPWNNILRMTAMASAARMGGAHGFVAYPFDLFSKEHKDSCRISRNIDEILKRESHLGHVVNPLEGSYSFSALVEQLLEKSWQLFVEIENKEGLQSVLRSGWLLKQLQVEDEQQKELFITAKIKLTGSNDFPLFHSLSDQYPLVAETDCHDLESWWLRQYSEDGSQKLCDVARFVPCSLPRIYEKFQFMSDRLREQGTSKATLPVFVEETMLNSQKMQRCRRILSWAGLEAQVLTQPKELNRNVAIVVAADPDSDFSKTILNNLNKQNCHLKIWMGDKVVNGFDQKICINKSLPNLFESIYHELGGAK